MADKLTLKGVKVVTNHTGNEINLVASKGGPSHKFPKWWNKKGSNQIYIDCTIFKITRADGDIRLVIPSSQDTRVTINYDGSDGFTFSATHAIDRAILCELNSCVPLVEYQFAKISGGSVLTRTINPLPTPD